MKIAFNLLNAGLGNNGGSRTLLKCAEILTELGHPTCLLSNVDNFTWFKHPRPYNHVLKDLDWIITAAAHDMRSTLVSGIRNKAWYIRGHEIWSMEEKEIIKLYNNKRVFNIVNSNGLKKLLEGFGAESEVVYQGIDFDWWTNLKLRGDKIRIGCLYNTMKTKRWKDFVIMAKALGKDYEYVAFGTRKCNDAFLTEYIQNPSTEQLNRLYSSCHIWLAPTVSEGLHNVPIEASLCGCLIIGNDNPNNGMINDYLFDGETGMIYSTIDDAIDKIRNPDFELVDKLMDYIKINIGDRQKNMIKLLNVLGN